MFKRNKAHQRRKMSKKQKVVIWIVSVLMFMVLGYCTAVFSNIPFIKKTDGSGSYINISMGQTVQDKRIFVSEDDYDKALKLIEIFISEENNEEIDVEMKKEIDKLAAEMAEERAKKEAESLS